MWFGRLFLIYGKTTLGMTCIPGGHKRKLFCGGEVHDIMFTVSKLDIYGCCLHVLTYDNRLQLTLTADSGRVGGIDNMNIILQTFVKYIDEMYEQCKSVKSKNGIASEDGKSK